MLLQLASGSATCKESRRQIALKNNVMVKGKKKEKTGAEYLMGGTTSSQTNQYGYSKHWKAHTVARREAGKGRQDRCQRAQAQSLGSS